MPLILIDDLDPLRGPSQVAARPARSYCRAALAGVFAHLNRGGLADVDLGQTVEMIRPDLRGKGGVIIGGPPGGGTDSSVTRLDARRARN